MRHVNISLGVLVLVLIISGLLVPCSIAKDNVIYKVEPVWDSTAITTSSLSGEYDLVPLAPNGYYSLQVDLESGNNITYIQVEVSNGGGVWSVATIQVAGVFETDGRIFETFTTTSGPDSDGVDHVQIGLPLCRLVRFRLASAGTSTVTAYLAIQ